MLSSSTTDRPRALEPAPMITRLDPSRLDPSRLDPFGVQITGGPTQTLGDIPPGVLGDLVTTEKLVLLRGFAPLERDPFLTYCRSFPGRDLVEWDFGPVMEMREDPRSPNYLFSREAVPFHWDGAFHEVPSFLVFHCIEAPRPGTGGQTLFCDTHRLFSRARREDQERMRAVTLTYETEKLAHYGGRICAPLVQEHPATSEPVLRYAEPVRTEKNPVTLRIEGIPEADHEGFLEDMQERIYAPELCYAHIWEDGDVLVADNHTLIHGRRAFEADSPRHLRRIQIR